MNFKKITIENQETSFNRLNEVSEHIKKVNNCNFVFYYDIHALCTWFDKNNLEFYKFEIINENIRAFENIRVFCCDLEYISKNIDSSFFNVKGRNNSEPEYNVNKSFYTKDIELCMYYFDFSIEGMKNAIKYKKESREGWKAFELIKPNLQASKLGTKFNVNEFIYDHFLNCMPPIYGKGCFYMSEPYTMTNEGKNVYYKLTREGKNNFFIELNIVE